jgi:VWFA-related protein
MLGRMRLRSVILSLGALALLWALATAQAPLTEQRLPEAPSAIWLRLHPMRRAAVAEAAPPKPSGNAKQFAEQNNPPPAAPVLKDAGTWAVPPAPVTPPPEQATQAGNTELNTPQGDITTTIRRTVNEVNVVFTVTDRHGHYVRDLKQSDFEILDDGKPVSEIRSFHSETDLPLRVGLMVDASNSVRERFKFEQQSAIEFLSQTIRPRYDQAFVIGFDVTPEVTQDFTDSTEALSQGVRSLRPGGGTALFDALYFACREKLAKIRPTTPVRKAIILLSDGDDNQSHVTREEAIDMAQRAEVVIYTISTNVMGGNQRGDKVLERIAEATGGRAFFPFQLTDVANAFMQIQAELRSQYALSYKPADFRPDGRYRTIAIVAKDRKHLRVRSRPGYYAPVAQ